MYKIEITQEQLFNKIQEGLSNDELAKFFNCSKRTISYKKAKFKLSTVVEPVSDSIQRDIIYHYSETTIPIKSLLKTYSISDSTLYRILNKHNVKRRTTRAVVNSKNCACPYCNSYFDTWKSVRAHISHCIHTNHKYVISLTEGSIDISQVVDFISFSNLKQTYPNIEPSLLKHIVKHIRKKGYTTKNSWTAETAKEAVILFFITNNRVPTSRDTYNNILLPSDRWVKKHYTTWNNFIVFCGLKPSSISGYGDCHKFKDGKTYRSSLEVYFVSNFLYNKLTYVYEKPYPGNTNRISDFYLPDYNLYIEIAGGLRPEVIKEKIQFCIDNKLKLLVLYPKQIYKQNFNLLEHIKDSLLKE